MCGTLEFFVKSACAVKVVADDASCANVGIRLGNDATASHMWVSKDQAVSLYRQFEALYGPSEHPLDDAWRAVDALGGRPALEDDRSEGYADGLDDACEVIEALGGMDPAERARLAKAQQTESV